MSVRVRFAPSPTGFLHVGGARTALYNYLFAKANGGTFVLRIEDTDAARSTAESMAAILEGMRWLGLSWDEGPEAGGTFGPYYQAERRDHYQKHARALIEAGRAYPCYCTAAELEERREAQLARGEAPRYDVRCRNLDAAGRARMEADGRTAALRFALPEVDGEVAWDDIVRGRVAFQTAVLDEFVILRSDGLPTYNFACVVDDHEMEISHVIRGDDHISNTPRQLLIYQAFGWSTPVFAHVPMILGGDGTRLSKRHGATAVGAYADLGFIPEAMVNFLVLLGWSYDGQREMFTLAELESLFRIERVGANASVFDLVKLEWMNGQHLKRLTEDDRVARVVAFLTARGWDLSGRSPEWIATLVRAIGDRLKTLVDAERYGAFALRDGLEIEAEAWAAQLQKPGVAARLTMLAERVGADPEFSIASLEPVVRTLAAEQGIKAGELIGSARVALTGSGVSPGIFEVMWLLGRERTVERLQAAAARWQAEAPVAS